MLLRPRALARALVKLAKAEVAVGDEETHAPWLGRCQGFAVVRLAVFAVELHGMSRDVPKEPPGVGSEPSASPGLDQNLAQEARRQWVIQAIHPLLSHSSGERVQR